MEVWILLAIFSIAFVQGYSVERRINSVNETTRPDRIIIPASECINDGKLQCVLMDAKWIDNCQCECTDVSHTFVLVDGQWKCAWNQRVMHFTSCTTKVTSIKDIGSEIFTVPSKASSTTEYIASISIFDPAKCGLYRPNSYMLCDGSWKESTFRSFTLAGRDQATITPSPKINSTLHGRIVRLSVDCYNADGHGLAETFCILLKVQGKQNCSTGISSSTARPITTSSITTSLVSVSTSAPPLPSLPGQPTIPYSTTGSTTPATTMLVSTANQRPTSTPHSFEITTSSQFIQKTPRQPTADSKSALIAGATVASLMAIVVLIVVVVIILGIRRRKSRRSSKTIDAVDNEAYTTSNGTVSVELSPNAEVDYSYAYYEAPIHSIAKVIDSENSRANRKTDTADRKSEPVYNTLEGPEYTTPGTSKHELVYHTLEGPNQQDDEPGYHTLETPHYMHLSNHVPHIYGTLVRPRNDGMAEDAIELQSYA